MAYPGPLLYRPSCVSSKRGSGLVRSPGVVETMTPNDVFILHKLKENSKILSTLSTNIAKE